MDRKILFKGLDKDNKKIWHTGYYWKTDDTTYCFKEDYDANPNNTHHYILFDRMTDWGLPNKKYQAEIDVETLCEYTGMLDKNGKKIWENDIVKPYDTVTNENYIISWDKEMGAFVFCDINTNNSLYVLVGHYIESIQSVEVIGNIFDNPELLERGVE